MSESHRTSSIEPASGVAPADVTVVVPVGGAAGAWTRAARSLARLDPPAGEVVVVIDGPDETLAAAAADIGATLVVLAERGGPARARNHGARTARGDVLLFIDADVVVPADLVARVADLFTTRPDVSAVFGSYDAEPSERGLVSQYRNLLHHYVHQTACDEASTFWAGCGAVRRRAFEEVGGFDERWVAPSIEDIELGVRLVGAGHAIRLVKDLQVTHLKRWGLADVLATDLWRRAVPWTRLMLAEGRLVNDLNVKTRDRVSVVLAFVAVLGLLAAWAWPGALGVVVASLVLVVGVNGGLFAFFLRQRGVSFTIGAIGLYWAYLLTCGLGFAFGLARHLAGSRS